MNQRPKCAILKCQNKAFVYFNGKWICGECLLKLGKQREENFWKDVECQQD